MDRVLRPFDGMFRADSDGNWGSSLIICSQSVTVQVRVA